MQTAELVAGRELDALIAEKVMGWREVRHTQRSGYTQWRGLPPDGIDMDPVPWFSTDVDDAWQVVEHMRATLNKPDIQILWSDLDATDMWLVVFGSAEGAPFATAETVSLAICRAALAAVDPH